MLVAKIAPDQCLCVRFKADSMVLHAKQLAHHRAVPRTCLLDAAF
jgi:hypothetical protein